IGTEPIISGGDDRVVAQQQWQDPRYQGDNVRQVTILNAGHFPWYEAPDVVMEAIILFDRSLSQ
ncbi:alpha/beta fold hydrolase, partial [Aeromonas jandaei]|uniref:alpha/beta fold hydrolase n=1 Tax=Aeromonas jandaei TaxID=650 RepID=UPI00195D7F49